MGEDNNHLQKRLLRKNRQLISHFPLTVFRVALAGPKGIVSDTNIQVKVIVQQCLQLICPCSMLVLSML